jgi:hypothetical protein
MHVGRAALIFWVAAILLPTAVVESRTVPQHSSPQTALLGVSTSAGGGLDRVASFAAGVDGAEDDVRRLVARVRLETERFIAQLP